MECDVLLEKALARCAPSSDTDIERLRGEISAGRARSGVPCPEEIARRAARSLQWGEDAFAALREGGFIANDLLDVCWYAPSSEKFDDELCAIAGMEAAAIIRASALPRVLHVAKLRDTLHALEAHAVSGDVLPTLLKHQHMMLHVVAAAREVRLFTEYASRASPAFLYVLAQRMAGDDLAGLARALSEMCAHLEAGNGREAAAAAVAARLHPGRPLG